MEELMPLLWASEYMPDEDDPDTMDVWGLR